MPYSQEDRERIFNDVCSLMEQGQSFNAACKSVGVPRTTVIYWCDEETVAQASDKYARARDRLIAARLQEIEDIADDNSNDIRTLSNGSEITDHDVIARARLRIDVRKWELSKLMPRRFGDKVQTEVTGKDGGPLRVARELTEAELLAIAAGAGGQPG